jgi:hypothetical protein
MWPAGPGRVPSAPSYGLPLFLEIALVSPPMFESQAVYLSRLGLLLPGEGTVNLSAEDREGWDAAGATRQRRHR